MNSQTDSKNPDRWLDDLSAWNPREHLEPDLKTPGLWVNKKWQQGQAGTFAVIIGVSQYAHLDDTSQTYTLGQLYVSALTAYRFFCWLSNRYHYMNYPLAKCWLLLSPTQEEITAAKDLNHHNQIPTLQNCSDAITSWYNTMKQLPKSEAQHSRSFFFFSGHGLEISKTRQILLPYDYLAPPGGQLDRALSTSNLYLGLADLEVLHQFFLVDACRNDHPALRAADIVGTRILTEWQNHVLNPDRIAPIIYSSVSGGQAFQPKNPVEGLSLFGQALIEGLLAPKNLALDCLHFNPCAIKVNSLLDFMRPRITQLLADQNASLRQSIPIGGNPHDDLPITQVTIGEPQRVDLAVTNRLVKLQEMLNSLEGWQPTVSDYNLLHKIFGSEQMTKIWRHARVYSLTSHKWLPVTDKLGYVLHNVQHGAGTQVYRFELSIPHSSSDYWLELNDGSQTIACILPGDANENPHYILEVNFEYGENGKQRQISHLEASLASNNPEPLNQIAKIWEMYSISGLQKAIQELDAGLARSLFSNISLSPLAATVAGIILLRTHRTTLSDEWSDLAYQSTDQPDGPVLWVEFLFQENRIAISPQEAIRWLLKLHERGLPRTAEALGYADELARHLLTLTSPGSSDRSSLSKLKQRLDQAMRFLRPGGLFSIFFAANDGSLTPQLVEGQISLP